MGYLNGTGLQQFWRKVKAYITTHTENRGNPHAVTKAQIGLGNVDNTSDLKKPISTAQQTAMDTHYQQATGYTDTKIAALINGAPSTLDTLGEIATAMQKNENVVNALDQAIGSKASEADFEGHRRDKSNPHSVTKNQVGLGNVPNVSTNDQTPTYTEATTLAELASGEKLSAAFGKLKLVTKNVISLVRLMGTTEITGIGNGTVTGAISSLNGNLTGNKYTVEVTNYSLVNLTAQSLIVKGDRVLLTLTGTCLFESAASNHVTAMRLPANIAPPTDIGCSIRAWYTNGASIVPAAVFVKTSGTIGLQTGEIHNIVFNVSCSWDF